MAAGGREGAGTFGEHHGGSVGLLLCARHVWERQRRGGSRAGGRHGVFLLRGSVRGAGLPAGEGLRLVGLAPREDSQREAARCFGLVGLWRCLVCCVGFFFFAFPPEKSFYLSKYPSEGRWGGGRCCGGGKGQGGRGRGERLLPRKEREESIKKCPDWLKKASRRREEKRRSLLVCADWFHLQSDCCGVRRGPLPSRPRRGRLSQGCNLLGDQLEVSE